MKKKWNIVGLLLAVFVAMMMVLPVKEAAGQQVISEEDLVEISPDYATRSIPYVAIFDNGTLTFKYDENKPDGNYNSWSSFVSEIKMVVFDKSCMKYSPTSCANWFRGFNNLVEFNGFSYLNTKNVTDMSQMFYGCSSLTELDLGSFNTSNVTNMEGMFNYCSNIQTIFVGDNWTTAKVTDYDARLFVECKKLVGGKGTACIDDECQWNANMGCLAVIPIPYARIDGGASNPGYFTKVGEPVYVQRDAYAVFEDGTLTFKYDENKPEGAYENGGWIWGGINADIKVVVFDKSFADYRPTDCAYWFSYCENLTKIQGVENLNTEEVTDMTCMFGWCRKIESLDLSHFNTAKVTDMNNMFCLCENLSDLDISSFNTEKVTSMAAMFYDCKKLTSLDLGNFNTKNVTNMSEMFHGSHGLTSINLSSFNTENVTNMDRMFLDCSGLQNLDLSNFNTKNVTSMAGMFQQTSLQRLDLNKFKTENVTNMAGMFNYCLSLIQLDLGSFNTKKVTDMSQMFRDCRIIKTIFVGDEWTTAAVTESDMMFYSCANLYGGKGTKCGESDIKYAHIDGGESNPGYLTKSGEEPFLIKVPYVISDEKTKVATLYYGNAPIDAYTFSSDDGRVEIKRSAYSTDRIRLSNLSAKIQIDPSFAEYKPTSCANWFAYFDCVNYDVNYDENHIREIDGLEYINTENVTDMSEMFAGCDFTDLDLSSLNTAKVTNMDRMFEDCENLETIYIGNKWSTSAVSSSEDMFWGCENLFGEKGTECVSGKVGHEFAKIDGGESNPGYFTQKGNNKYVFNGARPYAILKNNTLTFYYDNKHTNGAYKVRKFMRDWWSPEWIVAEADFTKVVFDQSFAEYKPLILDYWFSYCEKLTDVVNLQYLNTSNVTSMRNMFENCTSLTSLDLRSFDSENADLSDMFTGCSNLTTIYVGVKWSTKSFTGDMFSGCTSLIGGKGTEYDEKHIDYTYAHIDGGASNPGYFTSIASPYATFTDGTLTLGYGSDIPNDASKISGEVIQSLSKSTSSNYIASNITAAKNVKKVVFDKTFADYQPENCAYWFNGCNNLTGIDGMENLDTKNTTDMTAMFQNCEKLASLDLSGFNTTKVTDMSKMFSNCTELATIFVGDTWNMSNVQKSQDMFLNCQKLVGGNGTKYDANHSDEDFAKIDGKNSGYFTKAGQEPYKVAEPYAVFDNGTLTFYYDGNKPDGAFEMRTNKDDGWTSVASEITKVVFDNSFADYRPTSCECWFFNCSNLTKIEGIKNLNTEDVTSIRSIFNRCEKLESIDLSSFNTQNVTNMRCAFYGCTNLKALDLSSFNTKNVTDMSYMLDSCVNLKTVDLSSFNTQNVTDMTAMFAYCHNLTNVNLQGFNTANVEYMNHLFYHCNNLASLDLSKFNTEKVTNMKSMFYHCDNLKTLDLGSFNTKNVTDMSYMLDSCVNLKTVDLSSFNTQNVTDMQSMFEYCHNLTNVNLQGFNTANVEYMNHLFYHCENLTNLDLSKFNTEKVTTMKSMFCHCNNLKTLDLSSFNTKNVTDMSYMLDSCVNLQTVDLSSFNTKNVTIIYYMFAYCYNLATIDLSNFDTKNVTNMGGLFYKCTNLKTIDVSSFDTKNVTDMDFMFSDCGKLQNIDLNNFDTRNVTNMQAMFQSCASLQNLDLGCFNTKNVTDMSYMFTLCSSLNTIYVGDDWSTSSVTESKKMFPQCAALVGGKGTTFNSDKTDKSYARIDGGRNNPGYFTKSGEKPYEETTPVSEITPAKDNIDIWSFDKTIYVQNPGKEIRIADMSGHIVKTVKATADRMEIPMQKSGIYIVKTGAKTQKVMIQ